MIDIYKTHNESGKINKIKNITSGCWINLCNPTEDEIKFITNRLDVSDKLLRYSLDIAERPHIDDEDENFLITVDVPVTEYKEKKRVYVTMPLGMVIVKDDIFITVSDIPLAILEEIIKNERKDIIYTEKKSRFIFQLLYIIAQEYIKYMGYISKDIEAFEKHMTYAMKNEELLSLLDFEKTMIYYSTSLKANQAVFQRLNRGRIVKLYEEDADLLEDTIIENNQAIEMIQTYSEILNGIIDIFGTIVNNNVNSIMKFLTSITLVISIPTMIASFVGMNVEFPFVTSSVGFYLIILASVLITAVATILLRRKDMM